LEIVLCYYACFKIGAVAVPLNVRLKGPELEYVLHHSGARLYLGQADLFPEVQAVRSRLPGLERCCVTGDRSEAILDFGFWISDWGADTSRLANPKSKRPDPGTGPALRAPARNPKSKASFPAIAADAPAVI